MDIPLGDTLTDALNNASDYTSNTVNGAITDASNTVSGIVDGLGNAVNNIGDIGNTIDASLDIVQDAGNLLSSTLSEATSGLSDTLNSATSTLSSVTGAIGSIGSTLSSSVGNLTTLISSLSNTSGILSVGDKLLAGTLTNILGTLKGASLSASGITNAVSGAMSSLAGVAGTLTSTASSITSSMSLPGTMVSDTLNSTISQATSGVSTAAASISGAASSLTNTVSSLTNIQALLASATSGLSSALSAQLAGITSAIDRLVSQASSVTESLTSSLKEITGGLASLEVPMMSTGNQLTDIKSSVIWLDVGPIVNNAEGVTITPSIDILLKIHNEEHDLDNNDLVTLKNMIVSRDFKDSIGDYIEVNIQLPIGVYLKKVYPYLHNTEVTIIKDERLVPSDESEPRNRLERYKAVFLKDKNANLPTHKPGSQEDLNQLGLINLTLQLIDRSVEPLRIKTTYGIYDKSVITGESTGNYTIKDFLYSVMNDESVKIRIDGNACIDAIDIEIPDNKDRLSTITIPSGTRMLELPTLVQEKWNGVYNGGIGTYIMSYKGKKTLFVYSVYNPNKISSDVEKIIFYVPLTGSHSIGRYTYSYVDNVLKVVTDPNSNITDRKESDFMSTGNGVRITNSNAFMNNPIIATTAGPYFDKSKLLKEIIIKDRKDNLNYIPVKRDASITSNIFNQVSEINKAAGSIIRLVWHSADYELLFPGAAVTIATLGMSASRKDLKGVIQKVDITINGDSSMSGVTANRKPTFDVTCVIDIFVHKDSTNTEANE